MAEHMLFSKLTASSRQKQAHRKLGAEQLLDSNGSNKVVIELRFVQLWSEIILVISNHAYDFRPNNIQVTISAF